MCKRSRVCEDRLMSLRIVNYEKKKKEKIKGKTMKDKSLLREKKKRRAALSSAV